MKTRIFALTVAVMAVLGAKAQNMLGGHEYVDMGLPSGTLWATDYIEVEGSYKTSLGACFAFGYITQGTEDRVSIGYPLWTDYPHGNSASDMTKYNSTDGKTELDSDDDPATYHWGSLWQSPSKIQVEELFQSCSTSEDNFWMTFTGPNGNSIKIYKGYTWTRNCVVTDGVTKAYMLSRENMEIELVSPILYALIRPVVRQATISDVPEDWKVNGKTSVEGKVTVNMSTNVTVTTSTASIPAGKKIKSIKAVPVE